MAAVEEMKMVPHGSDGSDGSHDEYKYVVLQRASIFDTPEDIAYKPPYSEEEETKFEENLKAIEALQARGCEIAGPLVIPKEVHSSVIVNGKIQTLMKRKLVHLSNIFSTISSFGFDIAKGEKTHSLLTYYMVNTMGMRFNNKLSTTILRRLSFGGRIGTMEYFLGQLDYYVRTVVSLGPVRMKCMADENVSNYFELLNLPQLPQRDEKSKDSVEAASKKVAHLLFKYVVSHEKQIFEKIDEGEDKALKEFLERSESGHPRVSKMLKPIDCYNLILELLDLNCVHINGESFDSKVKSRVQEELDLISLAIKAYYAYSVWEFLEMLHPSYLSCSLTPDPKKIQSLYSKFWKMVDKLKCRHLLLATESIDSVNMKRKSEVMNKLLNLSFIEDFPPMKTSGSKCDLL